MNQASVSVGVGVLAVRRAPATLVTLGIGSCVAVMLYDPGSQVGGLAHVLLPSPSLSRRNSDAPPGRFATTAVPALVEAMTAAGAEAARITARLAGGASMFANLAPPGSIQMGERNVHAVREALHGAGIRVVGELVGGDLGRSVSFELATGRVEVRSVARGVEYL